MDPTPALSILPRPLALPVEDEEGKVVAQLVLPASLPLVEIVSAGPPGGESVSKAA